MSEDNNTFSVLIVDDEKEACTNLRNMLIEYVDPDINIAGMAYNTSQAEKLISKLNPDAIFLDIEMPNENAFHFLDRIAPFYFEVIFVTAYDEYAIRAFRLNAIDYILKPISIHELVNAYAKLKERLRYKKLIMNGEVSYTELSGQVRAKIKNQKITLKEGGNIEVVEFKDICFVEAQGSYSRILFIKNNTVKEIIMSSTLSDYEELLPTELFYRMHKSYLLNCSLIKKILKDETSQVLIRDNITLPISRRRFASFMDFLKSNDLFYE